MYVIHARNVHEALPEALHQLNVSNPVRAESRNGPVIKFNAPVTTVYHRPWERVLFWPERDANPFLHLFESLWMLAGRNDVAYVANIVERFKSYSDDGQTLHGAYGHRWRNHFERDQIKVVIERLAMDPTDRRCVITMWDPRTDLMRANEPQSRDVPCNTQIFFKVSETGALNMTVCNRSNDLVWGCYGANAVHMSFLQEYIAIALGRPVGRYWQVSDDLHVYENVRAQVAPLAAKINDPHLTRRPIGGRYQHRNPYDEFSGHAHVPLVVSFGDFHHDLELFLDGEMDGVVLSPFLRDVAVPMWRAFQAYRNKSDIDRFGTALRHVEAVAAPDWKRAATEWIARRASRAAGNPEIVLR